MSTLESKAGVQRKISFALQGLTALNQTICLIALGALLLVVPALRAATFNVINYGAKGNGVANDQPAIQAAINAAIAAGSGNTVSLPAGTYLLTTQNSDTCILDFNNSSNLTFSGAGVSSTKLVSSQKGSEILQMSGNTNIVLQNFSMDYAPMAYSQGTITAFSGNTVTFTTDSGFDQPNRSDLLPAGNNALYLWSNPKRVTFDTYYGAEPAVTAYTQTSPGVWSFTLSYIPTTPLFVGEKAAIWTAWYDNAISFNNNTNVSFTNVSMYNEGWSQGFYAAGNNGAIILTNFNMTPPPGSGHLLSVASGSQCGNRASMTLNGCNFISGLDDAMNTLAEWQSILAQPAGNQLTVNSGDYQQGDTLEIWNWPATSNGNWPQGSLLTTVTINNVQPGSSGQEILTLSASVSLPNGISLYKTMDNNQAGPVVVENGSFACARARPLLLKSGTSILVQNNLIYDSPDPLQLGAETGWTEGPRPINVTVKNNTFSDMDTQAVSVGVFGATANNLATNVVITGNTFENGGQETIHDASSEAYGNPISVENAVSPVISNNYFTQNWDANITLQNDTNVQITGNTFDSTNESQPTAPNAPSYAGSVIWADSTQGLTLSGNLVSNLGTYNTSLLSTTSAVTGLANAVDGIFNTTGSYCFNLPFDNMDMDDAGAGGAGTTLVQNVPDGATEQQWILTPASGSPGYFTLTGAANGTYAGVNSTSAGSTLTMQAQSLTNGQPSASQLWQLVPVDGQNVNIVNKSTGYCINDIGQYTVAGTQLCQWYSGSADNQNWIPSSDILPSGWVDADIGSPGVAGNAYYSTSGIWSVAGGGADIWNNGDQFNFAAQPTTVDGDMIAEVTGITNTDPWAKAGVMLRDSSQANSIFVDMVATEGNGVSMQWRNATGGSCGYYQITGVAAPTASAPVWVKLVKTGTTFTGSYSLNGTTWTQVGTVSVSFTNSTYLAGLAVTAHNNSDLNEATFTNAVFAGLEMVPGSVLTQGQYITSPNGQYILVQQADGNLVLYNGTDPAHEGAAIWGSGYYTGTGGLFYATLQKDGNLVTYQGTPSNQGPAVWGAGTYGMTVTSVQVTNTPEVQLLNGTTVVKQYP